MPWDDYWYYTPTKRIRVENGIRAKHQKGNFSDKWWAIRWIEVIESFHLGARLERGKSYARSGQVIDMHISPGKIDAKVQGSMPEPYGVTIKLRRFLDEDWEKIIDYLSSKAIYSAKLMAGEMPRDIEKPFNELHIPLFPLKYTDMETDCTCPDSSNPCKHIAAVYYIFAERFDEDPFLIFKLRGKDREDIIEDLRKRRSINSSNNKKVVQKSETIDNINSFFTPKILLDTFQINSVSLEDNKIKIYELEPPGFDIFYNNAEKIFLYIYDEVRKEAIKRIKKINENTAVD
ncbi:MAG: SWIM zinc finger family protein [Thermoplasmata archaeon]